MLTGIVVDVQYFPLLFLSVLIFYCITNFHKLNGLNCTNVSPHSLTQCGWVLSVGSHEAEIDIGGRLCSH